MLIEPPVLLSFTTLVNKAFFFAELNNYLSQSLFREDDLKKIERLENFIKVKKVGQLGSREFFLCGAKTYFRQFSSLY